MSETRFMTFPVALLKDAFTDIKKVCNNAMKYAIYSKAQSVGVAESFKFFGVSYAKAENYESAYQSGKVLYDSFEGSASPMVSVNKDILFQFIQQPKTEFEIAVFCAFCAVRSIIGKKQYAKTNNNFVLARLLGYRSFDEFEISGGADSAYYQKYFSTDKKLRNNLTDKIIKYSLVLGWGLNYYSGRNRGFYISFELPAKDLKLLAEKTTWAYKQKEYQKKQAKSLMSK